jgi:hypothetical protein
MCASATLNKAANDKRVIEYLSQNSKKDRAGAPSHSPPHLSFAVMSSQSTGGSGGAALEKVGKLHKRGAKRTNWLERTFVLKQGALCYFDGKTCKGVIPTKTFTFAKPVEDTWGNKSDKKMPCRWSLNTSERTYYFSCASFKEMEAWIKACESWIGVDNAQTRQRTGTNPELDDSDDNAAAPAAARTMLHTCPVCK